MTKCTCTYDVQCDACGTAEMLADQETERRMEAYYEGAGRFDQCWAENQADLEFHDSLFPDDYK